MKTKDETLIVVLTLCIAFLFICICFMAGELFTYNSYDLIPKSNLGRSFVYLNVEHCAQTYKNICWINIDEKDKIQDWKCMNPFVAQNRILVFR